MGMWNRLFGGKEEELFFDTYLAKKPRELYIKELLIEHGIDLIARTLAKSEIQVFREKGGNITSTIDDVYYLLNIRPNYNQDGTVFMNSVIRALFKENEVLVVRINNKLYLADSWEETNDVLIGKKYTKVVVSNGSLDTHALKETLYADDVMYMTLGQSKITDILDNFYQEYADMLVAAAEGYKLSKVKKYKLTLPHGTQTQLIDPNTGKGLDYNDYKNRLSGNILDTKSSITMLGDQFNLEPLNDEKVGSKTEVDDYSKLVEDFGNQVAMALNIPLDVFYGRQTDKSNASNEFITFAVSPIIEILEDSFNAKLISETSYLYGERIKLNTYSMKHFDITEVANSLDKLFAIGWSHNDLREILGQPEVRQEWANKHHVTKNYMDMEGRDEESE